MTNILITHPDLSFHGGAELVITEFCRYLGEHNIPHDVLTTRVSPDVITLTPKTNYITIPPAWKRRWQTGTAYAFWSYLKTHPDWDVINAHNYPAHLAAAGSSMPTVWLCNEPPLYHIQYHGVRRPIDLLKKSLLISDQLMVRRRIADVIVADQFNQDRVFRLYHRQSHIVHYGIDYHFFSSGNPEKVKTRYQLDNRFILLHVGLFSPLKNQMASVRCLEAILPDEPAAILILAGQGGTSYEKEVRLYVHEHGLDDNVIFTGHVGRDEVRDLYHVAHIALFPVRSQGSWLSPFEALCAGTPVIASPELTSAPIIAEQGLGTITGNYSGCVLDLIYDYSDYRRQAEWGRKWVRDNLRWDTFCKELYERCIMAVD